MALLSKTVVSLPAERFRGILTYIVFLEKYTHAYENEEMGPP